jgi:hypothetical protein
MDRLKVKCAPAIPDLTVEDRELEDDEGMEAVLWENGAKVDDSKSDKRIITIEKSGDEELLDIIQRRDWKVLMNRCQNYPHLAYVKFSGSSPISKGNLVLHEVCKQTPPNDLVEILYDANDSAVMIRGYGGYLPIHHACASGASDEVIQYLFAKYPEGVSVSDENEHGLPLHLACKMGASEDVYMLLLSQYPEAASMRDDFGRLPIDYAKSIRNAGTRDIALKCLKFAKWLQSSSNYSKQKTEREFESRIRGYEDCQAQHLKMIKEVHEGEIEELENAVSLLKKDAMKKTSLINELQQQLQIKNDEIEHKNASLTKMQVAMDSKVAKITELSKKLAKATKNNQTLSQEVDERSNELDLAIQDIETLNQHSEWLESVLTSIRTIANTEAPIVKSLHRREQGSEWSECSISQGFTEETAAKKFATAIPRFGKKNDTVDGGALEGVVESRSEVWDYDIDSVNRQDGH